MKVTTLNNLFSSHKTPKRLVSTYKVNGIDYEINPGKYSTLVFMVENRSGEKSIQKFVTDLNGLYKINIALELCRKYCSYIVVTEPIQSLIGFMDNNQTNVYCYDIRSFVLEEFHGLQHVTLFGHVKIADMTDDEKAGI